MSRAGGRLGWRLFGPTRRIWPGSFVGSGVTLTSASEPHGGAVTPLYDAHAIDVYNYLFHRSRSQEIAEELTAETFISALRAIRTGAVTDPSVAWLVTIARNKLVDHWRRAEREQRILRSIHSTDLAEPHWDAPLERSRALEVLATLRPQYRLVLVLRYVDELRVGEVAALLQQSEHAVESMLARARRSFRAAYDAVGGDDRG